MQPSVDPGGGSLYRMRTEQVLRDSPGPGGTGAALLGVTPMHLETARPQRVAAHDSFYFLDAVAFPDHRANTPDIRFPVQVL